MATTKTELTVSGPTPRTSAIPFHTVPSHETHTIDVDLFNAAKKAAEFVLHLPLPFPMTLAQDLGHHIGPFTVHGPAVLAFEAIDNADDVSLVGSVDVITRR